jgi:hypothetical protein
MDPVTIQQVHQAIDAHNILVYEFAICDICHRGVRYLFHRNNPGIKESIYRRSGCDCGWQEAELTTYQEFITVFNATSPEQRQLLWEKFLTSGSKKTEIRKKPVTEVIEAEPITKEMVEAAFDALDNGHTGFTQAELRGIFGESMPIDAVMLLYDHAHASESVEVKREKLRHIAEHTTEPSIPMSVLYLR